MSKKETLSKAELQKMTGLDFPEQNSQTEEGRKKSCLLYTSRCV